MKKMLLGACTVGLLSMGCLQEFNYVSPDQAIQNFGQASNMQLRDGYLLGDFQDRRGFDGDARLEGYSDVAYESSNVNIIREQRGTGAAMIILNVYGGTLDRAAPGAYQFDANSYADNGVNFSVNNCGGSSASSFDYDEPVSGTVTIEDLPTGQRQVTVETEAPRTDFAGNIGQGVDTASGTFTFQPQR